MFVVITSQVSGTRTDQPLFSRLWGSRFILSEPQGVRFRAGRDPVLFLPSSPGIIAQTRREMLHATREVIELAGQTFGDLEINTRVVQYEMAFRMHSSAPELTNLSSEPRRVLDEYSVNRGYDDGSFARNCLLTSRRIERGVRFVKLFHRGWDQHGAPPSQIRAQARQAKRTRGGDRFAFPPGSFFNNKP